MATFLQLCQQTARDSGTVSGVQPATVVAQTGWLGSIVAAVATAWSDIQNTRGGWAWMRQDFTGGLLANTAEYTPASFGITDHASWLFGVAGDGVTVYLTATGVSDEGPMRRINWDDWRRLYGRGAQTPGRPVHYAVRPRDSALCFGPTPDAAYTVKGEYRSAPQVLAANADIPAMPERFHDAIKYRALMLLGEHDEAPAAVNYPMGEYRRVMGELMRDQLPGVGIGVGAPLEGFGS